MRNKCDPLPYLQYCTEEGAVNNFFVLVCYVSFSKKVVYGETLKMAEE